MANRPKKMCTYPGCNELVINTSRCEAHKYNRQYEQKRLSANDRGYTYRWQKYSKAFIVKNPLCVKCLEVGDITPTAVVDHVVPHKGDQELFWNKKNHQALCKKCHDKKTASEDGGFGQIKANIR